MRNSEHYSDIISKRFQSIQMATTHTADTVT